MVAIDVVQSTLFHCKVDHEIHTPSNTDVDMTNISTTVKHARIEKNKYGRMYT